jgi:hypothetical protein
VLLMVTVGSWLSEIAKFLSPLVSPSVIVAYAGLIIYTNYGDHRYGNHALKWTHHSATIQGGKGGSRTR